MQLLSLGIDVPQQDIVRDDVFHKGGFVVLLLIRGLGSVEGHHRHGAQGRALRVLPLDKSGVIELSAPAGQRLEGLPLIPGDPVVGGIDGRHRAGPMLTDTGELTACHDDAVRVNDTHHPVDAVLHLEYDSLEHPAGHIDPSHVLLVHYAYYNGSPPVLARGFA